MEEVVVYGLCLDYNMVNGKQNVLKCAGETLLAAALLSALVNTNVLLLTQEYLNLLCKSTTVSRDEHTCASEPLDAEGGDDDDEDEDEDEGDGAEDLSSEDGEDVGKNPTNKSTPKKGPGGAASGGAEENGDGEEDDGDDDGDDDDDDDDDDNEGGEDDEGGEEGEEEVEEDAEDEDDEEEEEEDEEEALPPPKKRKK